MKKISKIISLGLLTFSLAACSCDKNVTVNSALDKSSEVYSGTKTSSKLTTQDIYRYIRENQEEEINKVFLKKLMEKILNISDSATKKTTYDLKVKQYFQDNFLNNDEYKINGVFNEDLLASNLQTKLYIIDKVNLLTSGPTAELGLKYDYSDFIKRSLDYDIFFEMLKEEYISNNRQSTLDNSKTRIISIFSTDDLEDMEQIVDDLFEGKYANLEQVADSKRAEEIEELGRQYCLNLGYENAYYEGSCSATTSSSTYDSALYKFTVCENGVRCTPSEGFEYQIQLAEDKKYVEEKVVNKDSSDILYEDAFNQLIRSDVENHLYKVIDGEDKFLINGLYNSDSKFARRDIILSSGSNGSYYLVTVRVVNSSTNNVEDKEKALALLLDKVSTTTVLLHYLEDLDVEITDPLLKEYYQSLIGK